jgi:outer membrane receptor protein involved in Fe transport
MTMTRWITTAAAVVVTLGAASARAQVTTGSIGGRVVGPSGEPLADVQMQIVNGSTGITRGVQTRTDGRYLIQGLEVGDNYRVTARRIGYAPQTIQPARVTLGQTTPVNFTLQTQAAQLSAVTVTATQDPVISQSKTGTSTTISDSALRRLPTLNRNFQDFVSLVPQVSTTTGYLSGGGVNLRQNAIQIDGAQSGDIFGLGTTGQPGAQANAKSIPLDAVKEYQVLLSPFDVRQGNFGGLLLNAVTKSGTNEYHGTVYGYTRDQKLTRTQPYLNDFTQQQYGGTFGGPILKDRAFFFLSGEVQRQQQPASGPFVGSSDAYVSQASIDQLNQILSSRYGFSDAGTGEQVQRKNPNKNLFARVDVNLPWSTRLALRHNYADADQTTFSRGAQTSSNPNFNLTSNKYEFSTTTNSTVAQFFTNLTSGAYNELLLNRSTTKDFRTVPVNFPQITVRGIPRTDVSTGFANFVVGTEASSQGNSLDQRTYEVTDNLTIPVGSHSVTLGTKNIFYKSINLFAQNSRGSWTFSSLDSLSRGLPQSYVVSAPAPTDPYNGLATIRANTYALYVQDNWAITPTFTLNYGVRWDKPDFQNLPPENDVVFQQYGRHTSSVPSEGQFSPRLGFNWDVTGNQRNQLRGGIGSFSGAVPFVYLSNAFGNSGLSGYSSLTCTGAVPSATATTSLQIPQFTSGTAQTPPTSCSPFTRANGQVVPGATITGPAAGAAVNTIDPGFHYPKYLKGTLGYDRRIGQRLVATVEGLYTYSQQNAFYQNLALVGPTGATDAHGRVLYGTFTATGATAATKGSRTQVLDLTNASGDKIWSVTGQLQKTFSQNWEGSLAYTYQQAKDVVSITSSTAGSNYRYQRDVAGRLDDRSLTRSKYDQPHKIIATGTYRAPWAMDLSFIYTGASGAPFDFVYGGSGILGDANADGQTQNDRMYVPTNATTPSEILFTGYNGNATAQASAQAQAQAFEQFISKTDCLNEQRGRIMERNSCRNPWINEVDITVAQSLGKWAGPRFQNLQLRWDVINFGNLLNKNWGKQAFSDQGSTCGQICSATVVLTQTGNAVTIPAGQTTAPTAQGIYTFNPNYQTFNSQNASSNYRMQLSVRYSF